jgi:hypothetical protein
MTNTMHRFPDMGPFGQRMQEAELDYLSQSEAASQIACRKLCRLALLSGEGGA